jgi:hypothetical protein
MQMVDYGSGTVTKQPIFLTGKAQIVDPKESFHQYLESSLFKLYKTL